MNRSPYTYAVRRSSPKERPANSAPRVSRSTVWGLALLRVVVGLVFFLEGGQKLLKLALSDAASVGAVIALHGLPFASLSGLAMILLQFFGGFALLLGVWSRGVAILLALLTALLTVSVHVPNAFVTERGGYEYPIVLLAATIAIALANRDDAAP